MSIDPAGRVLRLAEAAPVPRIEQEGLGEPLDSSLCRSHGVTLDAAKSPIAVRSAPDHLHGEPTIQP
jgi:hypothetical protein